MTRTTDRETALESQEPGTPPRDSKGAAGWGDKSFQKLGETEHFHTERLFPGGIVYIVAWIKLNQGFTSSYTEAGDKVKTPIASAFVCCKSHPGFIVSTVI